MTQRVAFVTGGANGLGFSTVRAMLEAGWDVFFTYRNSSEEAHDLTELATQLGRQAHCVQADLLDRQQVEASISRCLDTYPRVDAFIHNFGPFVFERVSLADYSDELWHRMMRGNLDNFFWYYRSFAPGMRERGFGRIVTIGYDGAAEAAGWRYRAAYAAAKTGLASLTKSIAREERQNGITANMVCPGDIRGTHKRAMIRDVAVAHDPMGRPPVGEDVARMIVFLCEDNSQQLNGTVTEVTGGYDVLAYDDGKDVVHDDVRYDTGEAVWVVPWQRIGNIVGVQRTPNRNAVYEVESDTLVGHFTAYQLQRRDAEGV